MLDGLTLATKQIEEAIQWFFRTNHFNAPIVGYSSPLRLENKSSIHLVACRVNLSVVPNAAEQGRQSVTEMVTTATGPDPGGRCTVQHARSAAKTHNYHSSPAKVHTYIVANATTGAG